MEVAPAMGMTYTVDTDLDSELRSRWTACSVVKDAQCACWEKFPMHSPHPGRGGNIYLHPEQRFCMGGRPLFCSYISSIICVSSYGHMGLYFILWVRPQSYLSFSFKAFRLQQVKVLSGGPCVLCHIPVTKTVLFFLEDFHHQSLWDHLVSFLSAPRIIHFCKWPQLPIWKQARSP